jgi:hypothetical protein
MLLEFLGFEGPWDPIQLKGRKCDRMAGGQGAEVMRCSSGGLLKTTCNIQSKPTGIRWGDELSL